METKFVWLDPIRDAEQQKRDAYRFGYRDIRYHSNDRERQFLQHRSEHSWHHARPWSVHVAAIGYHWAPGSWQKVMEMVHYTQEQGIYVAFLEIMDRCFQPYDALGVMRNEAIMKARQGFEWLLYVDCDVLPEKDFLVRLLKWDVPIVAPLVLEPGTAKPLHGPLRNPNTGLQPVRWTVLSMLLLRTSVFNATGYHLWDDPMGADEGYHFQILWDVGHRPYLDTSMTLNVSKPPTYPLATNRMMETEAKSFWDKRRDWLLEVPNRQPIDPNDPRQENGEFMPWAGQQPALAAPAVGLYRKAGTV